MRQHDSRENVKEFIVTSPHVTPHPIVSRLETRTLNSRCEPKKRTMTSARRPRANQTPRNATIRHVRHIFTQDDQIIKK